MIFFQGAYKADCTISLINSADQNILVDTGGPWDKDFLLKGLFTSTPVSESLYKIYILSALEHTKVDWVVCTHGHSDHVGNLNLFADAKIIVSHDICKGETYLDSELNKVNMNEPESSRRCIFCITGFSIFRANLMF